MPAVWLQSSIADLRAIELYIDHDNPAAARAVKRRIVAAVGHLERQPNLGRGGRIPGTRELIVPGTPYIVAYTAMSGEVVTLAVIHGARKWPGSV